MDDLGKKHLILIVLCWISFKGCAAQTVTVAHNATFWVEDQNVSLSCQVTGSPNRVSWTIGSDILAQWNADGNNVLKEGGKYNMTWDGRIFQLLIYNVSISDAAIYICSTPTGTTGINFGTTEVFVNDAPNDPFPSIDGCEDDNGDDHTINNDCHIDVFNETDTTNLTCSVNRFYPNVTITWTLRGAIVDPVDIVWHHNDDGTYCGSVTIPASPQGEGYVCTVTGDAVRDMESKEARVVVQVYEEKSTILPTTKEEDDHDNKKSSKEIGLIIAIVIACFFGLLFLGFIFYAYRVKTRERTNKYNKQKYEYADLNRKQGGATLEEDDERRATGDTKPNSGGAEKDSTRNDLDIVDEVDENEEKKKLMDGDSSEKTTGAKAADHDDQHGDHGSSHGRSDHHDHDHHHDSTPSSGGGGGGGGSSHHDSTPSYSHSSGGGSGGYHSSGGGGGGSHDHDHGDY